MPKNGFLQKCKKILSLAEDFNLFWERSRKIEIFRSVVKRVGNLPKFAIFDSLSKYIIGLLREKKFFFSKKKIFFRLFGWFWVISGHGWVISGLFWVILGCFWASLGHVWLMLGSFLVIFDHFLLIFWEPVFGHFWHFWNYRQTDFYKSAKKFRIKHIISSFFRNAPER